MIRPLDYDHDDAPHGLRDRHLHLDAARDRRLSLFMTLGTSVGVALVILGFLGVVMTALFTALS
jgi:hypothetical protein